MNFSEKFLHISYALSIMIFGVSMLQYFVDFLQLEQLHSFIFMSCAGIVLLAAGLFQFYQGLSLGLTLAGVAILVRGIWMYWDKVSDMFKFVIAFAMLIVVVYAMYRMLSQKKD